MLPDAQPQQPEEDFTNLSQAECQAFERFLTWKREHLLPMLGAEVRSEIAEVDRKIRALRTRLPQQFLFPTTAAAPLEVRP
jgi:hypothetical protein